MEKKILQKLDIHLSKVILLRDAFSEEVVAAGMQIRTFQGGKPVVKPGGYCLFLNMEMEEFEIEIESPIYQNRKVLLKTDHGETVEEVFLYPSAAYPLKNNATIVVGNARPKSVLRFHLEEDVNECKLLCDYQEGEERISIFTRERSKAKSRVWFVRDKEKKTGEYFQVQNFSSESGICQLKQPLSSGYRKKDAVLYQAFECIADENGEFYLPLARLKEQKYKLYYSCAEAGEKHLREVEIQGTKKNLILES